LGDSHDAFERRLQQCHAVTIPCEPGKFDLALGDYGRALDLVPLDAFLFRSRVIALHRLGRSADALKDLARALLVRPTIATMNAS